MKRALTMKPRVRSLIIRAARRWRTARDRGEAVQPALFATLEPAGCGVLAPVLDSLILLFEASSGHAFRAAHGSAGGLSADERQLLDMLEDADGKGRSSLIARADRRLGAALQIAIRSTRIMVRAALRATSPDHTPGLRAMPA